MICTKLIYIQGKLYCERVVISRYSTFLVNPFTLRGALKAIVCYSHTFENNLGIK